MSGGATLTNRENSNAQNIRRKAQPGFQVCVSLLKQVKTVFLCGKRVQKSHSPLRAGPKKNMLDIQSSKFLTLAMWLMSAALIITLVLATLRLLMSRERGRASRGTNCQGAWH